MKRFLATLGILCVFFAPVTVAAYTPLGDACSTYSGSTADRPAACNDTGSTNDPLSGPNGALRKVTTIVALLAAITAVIIIIIGGLMYITSEGDPQKASKARSIVLGAIIGLVIIAAAQGILTFVLSKV